jgi:diaminopimelate epimerase
MKILFHKYHGTGNDFILIDNRPGHFIHSAGFIRHLCDRHTGIGGDGLILLNKIPDYDFSMVYYNSDGEESTMCGNGGRCAAAFARRQGMTGDEVRFMAVDGDHEALITGVREKETMVRLRMNDVSGISEEKNCFIIDTGSPHYITFVKNVLGVDVYREGRNIRFSGRYGEKGINVNFVGEDEDPVLVRTYERGVENETLSCGTGIIAAAIALNIRKGPRPSPLTINTLGGELKVHYRLAGSSFHDIWLEGPATAVFEGKLTE